MLLSALIICIIVLSLVPPVSKDALVHHLAVPKLYLQHGGMYEIPSMVFSYFPMNLDLLYMLPLICENDIAPKLIHFSFALLTAGLIFCYLKRRINRLWALLGVLLFLSTPIIIKLSITAYVDLGLIFFSTASIMCLFRWIKSGFKNRYLVLSGLFCGLAMGTKYNGIVTFGILSAFVPFIFSRYSESDGRYTSSCVRAGIFIFVSLLIFSPWMIRNWQWQKNPIYPLYGGVFYKLKQIAAPSMPSSNRDENREDVDKKACSKRTFADDSPPGTLAMRRLVYGETGLQILMLPARIFFEGKDGIPQFFDGKLNPLLIILPFFAFLGTRSRIDLRRIKGEKNIWLLFAVLFFSFVLFTTVLRIRYIAPVIPPLVILSVFGLHNLVEYLLSIKNRTARRSAITSTAIVVFFCLGINVKYLVGQFDHIKPISYLSGDLNRHEYIEKFRFEYSAMRFINENLPQNAKIGFLFIGKRGYYCDREYIPDNAGRFRQIVNSAKTPFDVYSGLKKLEMTHILVQMKFFNQWASSVFDSFHQDMLMKFLKNHLKLEFTRNDVALFRLDPDFDIRKGLNTPDRSSL